MPDIAEGLRYETEFEGLRLVVESREDHWQFFVYDVERCEVLETRARPTVDDAKLAALEVAAPYVFGPKHGLKLEVLAAMLLWETPVSSVSQMTEITSRTVSPAICPQG